MGKVAWQENQAAQFQEAERLKQREEWLKKQREAGNQVDEDVASDD